MSDCDRCKHVEQSGVEEPCFSCLSLHKDVSSNWEPREDAESTEGNDANVEVQR